jgi:Domain of Unknown Function (DUF1206)
LSRADLCSPAETESASDPVGPRGSILLTAAARIGYGARGVVYLLIGGLSMLAALDLGGQTVGTRGALRVIFAQPAGMLLLGCLAGGFASLALWRLIQAFLDPASYGRDWKGIGIRTALGASALAYLAIAVFAVRLMLGWAAADPSVHGAVVTAWLASLMAAPFGPWIAGAAGLAVIATGLIKITKAWRADLGEHLECGRHIQAWAVPVSRIGLTARGVVFLLIGGSIVTAAVQTKADRAAGLAGILGAVERSPFGWMLLASVALGLVSFGIFGLIEAMYRRINSQDID